MQASAYARHSGEHADQAMFHGTHENLNWTMALKPQQTKLMMHDMLLVMTGVI